MEPPKSSRAAGIAVSIFALFVLSFFILRASLNLMNQRSDLNLLLGITGVAFILLLWGLSVIKLINIMGCKECRNTKEETTTRKEEK